MKKLVLVILAVLLMSVLVACGSKSIEEIEGNTYECARFSAKCPAGWINVPVKDSNDKVVSDQLRFFKMEVAEGEDPGNRVYSNAYVDIACNNAFADGKTKENTKNDSSYKNVEDIELEIKDKKWKGISGEYTSERKTVYLWLESAPEWWITLSLYDVDGNLDYNDVEIQAILDSLQKK